MAAAFKKNGGDLDAAIKAVDLEAWTEFYVKNYMAIIEDFGGATLDGFKSYMPSYQKAWNPWTNTILGRLFDIAADKVTKVTDFTKQLIRGIVYTGREEGHSISTIARDLDKGFSEFSTHRAYRIARTEVVAASNYGSQMAAEEAAEEVGSMRKEWISSADSRVRETHDKIDGETVGLYEKYSNGLQFPGDPTGPAKEVIHCRCTQVYNPIAY